MKGYDSDYTQSLPRVLTKEEETKAIELLFTDKRAKAREVLINHNLRLVGCIVTRNFSNTKLEYEDLFSVGTIGLVKGVDTFDPKKAKITTYLGTCISNEILMYIRRMNKNKKYITVSFEQETYENQNGDSLAFGDLIADETDFEMLAVRGMYAEEQMSKVNSFLSKLDDRKRRVFEKCWGINGEEKRKQQDIAISEGLSQSYVCRINDKTLKDLAVELKR